jgi:hypothetical protein
MSTQNQISIVIPQAVIDVAMQNLQDCKTALAPYLQGLTNDQRQSLFKMGDKTVAVVQKTKSYVETNPEFVPSYMDEVEFLKDETVVTQLEPIANLARQITSDVDDTVTLSGSEALQQAMLYYGQVKEAANKGIATATPIYEDLSKRFARRSKFGTMPKQE